MTFYVVCRIKVLLNVFLPIEMLKYSKMFDIISNNKKRRNGGSK